MMKFLKISEMEAVGEQPGAMSSTLQQDNLKDRAYTNYRKIKAQKRKALEMNSKFYAKAGEVLKENEDYVKNTKKFIDDLLDNDGLKKLHDFLKGLKDFLDENKFLTPKQQDALDKIKGNLGRKK